jgi:hypothetical protein
VGRAADAVEDTEALERLGGSTPPTRPGPLLLDRTAGDELAGLLCGERSNLSASAFTLFDTCGEARVGVAVAVEAGPETDLGPALLGGRTAPFAVGWRWRVVAMSGGRATISCWVVEV